MSPDGTIGFAIAFSAGLLSFLSPCVLPLVPSYVSFITGMSLDDVQHGRRAAFVHTLLFVAGFTLVFLALGASATVLGRMLGANKVWISRAGGVLVVVFGLFLLGVINVGVFSTERRVHLANKPLGYLGTVVVGIAFGAGWTPCIGPVLGAILTYAASSASLSRGLLLLLAYSMGLAIPFVLASLALGKFFTLFQSFRKYLGVINKVSGTVLIVVGLLMITNRFSLLAAALARFTPAWLLERL